MAFFCLGDFFTACLMAVFAASLLPYFLFIRFTDTMMEHRWFFDYAWIIWACLLIPCLYFLARLSLLLPATAVGMRKNIEWALKASQGNGWRLFLTVSFYPVVFSIVIWPLAKLDVTPYLLSPLVPVMLLIEICALSLSFKYLTKFEPRQTYEQT